MASVTLVLIVVALGAIAAWREMYWRGRLAEARESLTSARSELSARNELADVGQLVSGLAQELKSPLQGVLGNTELMMASAGRDESAAEELEQIRENATRAAGIVRNLLAFAETTSLSCRWQDLNEVVARAINSCEPRLSGAGVKVRLDPAERLPLVYVDGRQLERVVATFLERSDAATVHGASRIWISTRRGAAADDRLTIDIDEDGATTGDDQAVWSGELAACHRVMEAHGGTLSVEPRAGGVRIRLELPIAAGAPSVA